MVEIVRNPLEATPPLTSNWALTFATLAPPLAWSLHLMINFGVTSHACFTAYQPRMNPLPEESWFRLALSGVDVIASTIALAGACLAAQVWRRLSKRQRATTLAADETVHGRERFLAIWGFLIGAGFTVLILSDFGSVWMLPQCG